MSWSTAFTERLRSRTLAMSFKIETINVWREPGATIRPIYSHPTASQLGGFARLSSIGQRITPVEWTSQLGAFQVDLVGEDATRYALSRLTRGQVLAVYAGFEDMAEESWQRIAVGVIRNMESDLGAAWGVRIMVDDLITGIRQRFDNDGTECALFADQPVSTTLTANYTAGDTSATVASATPFGTLTSGVVRIVPSSGDPFYVRYTGRSGTTLTLSSSAYLGSTLADASSGAQVYVCAWISDHPLDIVRRILCSRDGSNGYYDTLPETWGLALPEELVDLADITEYRERVWAATSGLYSWNVLVEAAQDDAFGWLQALLAPAGGYLAMRQGSITARCCARLDVSTGLPIRVIEPEDRIAGARRTYESHSSAQRIEYCVARVLSYSTFSDGTATDTATMPTERRRDHDLSAVLLDNESDSRTGDLQRLADYDTRIPERIVDTLVIEFADLCIGDQVYVNVRDIPTRYSLANPEVPYQFGIVDSASVDWAAGTVEVGILIYPPDEAVFS